MSRTIDGDVVTASKAAHAGIVVALVRMGFDSGDVLAAGAPWPILWDWDGDTVDETFIGVGQLGKVSRLAESADVRPWSISLELSGIDPSLVSIAMAEHYQGRDLRVWRAFLNQSTHAIVGVPKLEFRGRMDTMNLKLGVTATITVTGHSRLSDWDRPRTRRYTNEDQQALWPGDKGQEFTAGTAEKELVWG